eukprot:tig00021435_g21431.t1
MERALSRASAAGPAAAVADAEAAIQAAQRALGEFKALVQEPHGRSPNGGLYGYIEHQLASVLEATRYAGAGIARAAASPSAVIASEAERALASLADACEHTEIAEMIASVSLAEHEALDAVREGALEEAGTAIERAARRADIHLGYKEIRKAVRGLVDGRVAEGGDLANLVRPAVTMGTSDWGRACVVPWSVAKHMAPQRRDRAPIVWVADPPPPGGPAGIPKGLRLGPTPRHGRGLFAERRFESGEMIIEEPPLADVALQGFEPETREAASLAQGFLAAALAARAAGARGGRAALAALAEGGTDLEAEERSFYEAFLEDVLVPLRAAPDLSRVDRDLYWTAARALARGLHFSSVSDAPPDDEGRPGYRPPPAAPEAPLGPVRVLRKRVYPTISLLNSACDPNAATVDTGRVAAARAIAPGEEVRIYYGPGYFSAERPCTCDRCFGAGGKAPAR